MPMRGPATARATGWTACAISARLTPHDSEGPIALAITAIEAREWDEARKALEPLLEDRLTQRVCTLMARIEGEQHGHTGRVREWLARAVNAPRDPAWTADGVVSDRWAPVSPVTGALDAFRWRVPVEAIDEPAGALLAPRSRRWWASAPAPSRRSRTRARPSRRRHSPRRRRRRPSTAGRTVPRGGARHHRSHQTRGRDGRPRRPSRRCPLPARRAVACRRPRCRGRAPRARIGRRKPRRPRRTTCASASGWPRRGPSPSRSKRSGRPSLPRPRRTEGRSPSRKRGAAAAARPRKTDEPKISCPRARPTTRVPSPPTGTASRPARRGRQRLRRAGASRGGTPMRVVIVGGGIGGLTLALMLQARGIGCEIYEASARIRELGVGINVLPHAIAELAELGLLPRLDEVAIRTRELIYANRFGQEIWREPRGVDAGYKVPQFSIHRGRLQGVLRDAVVERLGRKAIRTGHAFGVVRARRGRVKARFKSGNGARTTVAGDILVGCDGIHSAVRRQLYPERGRAQVERRADVARAPPAPRASSTGAR